MAKRSHPSYNNSPLPQSIQPPHKIRKLNNLNSNLPPAPRANAVEPVGHQASRLESPSALIHPSILYPGQYLPTQMYQQGPMPSVVPPAPIYPPLPPVPMHKPLANQSTSSTSSSTIQQGQSNTQKSTQYPKVQVLSIFPPFIPHRFCIDQYFVVPVPNCRLQRVSHR